MANLEITLKRSLIGRPQKQHQAVQSLGLRKLHSTVVRPDNEFTRGAIKHIAHLVDVKEV
ncbi:LSU ribosomal protein L30p (L7e) [Alkalibacterium sp. AK22]|uniref:50S ribosomal protein L30 n=1 Tax=Alkalibacterium sp. AK22 TaxID=1229520 RepID=UPI0004512466|nr:50S ribosomal protein L30 [Alkalibacterium sp. AK22]EXJ23839.1 LSU ribosomal protein L30p (L7e) [Alkalibacterium sp. AK22]